MLSRQRPRQEGIEMRNVFFMTLSGYVLPNVFLACFRLPNPCFHLRPFYVSKYMLVSRSCLYLLSPLPLHLLDCAWNIKRSGGKARERVWKEQKGSMVGPKSSLQYLLKGCDT